MRFSDATRQKAIETRRAAIMAVEAAARAEQRRLDAIAERHDESEAVARYRAEKAAAAARRAPLLDAAKAILDRVTANLEDGRKGHRSGRNRKEVA